jgi:hypothetical protein
MIEGFVRFIIFIVAGVLTYAALSTVAERQIPLGGPYAVAQRQ